MNQTPQTFNSISNVTEFLQNCQIGAHQQNDWPLAIQAIKFLLDHIDHPQHHPFSQLQQLLINDPDYAWTIHRHISIPLTDILNKSEANIMASKIMYQLFNVNTSNSSQFQEYLGGS